jgi:hypothetical protein
MSSTRYRPVSEVIAEGGFAAVGAELSRRETAWQRAVRDPDVPQAFVASRRDLRARVADVAARFLAEHLVRTGWDAESLTVVLIALSTAWPWRHCPTPPPSPGTCSPGCSPIWSIRSSRDQRRRAGQGSVWHTLPRAER